MSANTISLDKVVDPGIKKHFVDGYKEHKPRLEAVFKIGEQTSKTDEYQNYTGIAGFAQVNEGAQYSEDAPIQAYGHSMTAVKFGKMIPVTWELTRWSKVKDIYDAARMLGKAAAQHVERAGASVINNATSTSYTSYSDGKPLASVLHPSADGGATQSNASATGIAFGEANLETGLLALEFQKNDRAELINTFATQLVIPNALRKSALTVLKSTGRAETADNDTNVYGIQEYYGAIKIVVWPYLSAAAGGSDTQWMLQDMSTSRLEWQWADKPAVKRDDSLGFKTDVTYYKGFYVASKGWGDWRGTWFSLGAGAALAT